MGAYIPEMEVAVTSDSVVVVSERSFLTTTQNIPAREAIRDGELNFFLLYVQQTESTKRYGWLAIHQPIVVCRPFVMTCMNHRFW
jgi:hypothetical protein